MSKLVSLIFLATCTNMCLHAQKGDFRSFSDERFLFDSLYLDIRSRDPSEVDSTDVDRFVLEVTSARYVRNSEVYLQLLPNIDRALFSQRSISTIRRVFLSNPKIDHYLIVSGAYLGIVELEKLKGLLYSNGKNEKGWLALLTLGRLEAHPYDSIAISSIRKMELSKRFVDHSKSLAYMNTPASFNELISMLNSTDYYTDIENDQYFITTKVYWASYVIDGLKAVTQNLPEELKSSRNIHLLRDWYNSGFARRNPDAFHF